MNYKDITYCKFFVTVKESIKEDEGEGAEGAVEKVQWCYYYLTNNDDTFVAHHDLGDTNRQIWFFDAAHEGPTPLKSASTG